MPDLIKLYIRSGFWGLALAGAFVGLLLGFDVMHLRGLIMGSDMGIVALLALWMSNAIVFGGVQFAISVMSLAGDDTPRGGLPIGLTRELQPIAVEAQARDHRRAALPRR